MLQDELWKTVPKPLKTVFEKRTVETEFLVFEFWGQFGSIRFLDKKLSYRLETGHQQRISL